MSLDLLEQLEAYGRPATAPRLIVEADGPRLDAHRRLRRDAFVADQGLFDRDDLDDWDACEHTKVLVALDEAGAVLGGVRLHPACEDGVELGWWRGSRLVCADGAGLRRGVVGAALVRAACAAALDAGALRFDAHVQARQERFFARLGWRRVRTIDVAGRPHVLMMWDVTRVRDLVEATKSPLGGMWGAALRTPAGWLGDDGVPLPGTDVVACTDAIVPSMVERDPEWAGWCAMLVTAHDLAAMGATPIGALDALGAADARAAGRVIAGLTRGAEVFDLPILGGHTQLGVPAALSVTGLGRTDAPVPHGGGAPGDTLTVTADVEGGWRPGYRGRQWDSSTHRTREEMRAMLGAVAAARPTVAKDVSMAGIVGTTGMLAEASGAGATLDVARIPRPRRGAATGGDWLTCFPGFAMVTAHREPARLDAGPARSAACGRLESRPGVRLRWPDGETTTAVSDGVTNLHA